MGDRVNVYIEIGGELPVDRINEFVRLCDAEDLKINWVTELTFEKVLEVAKQSTALRLGANEVNYGNLEELEPFLRENDLYFYKAWDRGCDFGAGGELRDKDGELDFLTNGNDDRHPAITVEDIRKLTLPELMARVERLWAPTAPLQIIGAKGPITLEDKTADG